MPMQWLRVCIQCNKRKKIAKGLYDMHRHLMVINGKECLPKVDDGGTLTRVDDGGDLIIGDMSKCIERRDMTRESQT